MVATGSARLAPAQRRKKTRSAGITYIGALLALELGDGIVSGGSKATDLKENHESQSNWRNLSVVRVMLARGGSYLRHGGDEAGGDADGAQALTSSREVSGSEHREEIPSGVRVRGIDCGGGRGMGGGEEERSEKVSKVSAPPRSDRDAEGIGGSSAPATRVHFYLLGPTATWCCCRCTLSIYDL